MFRAIYIFYAMKFAPQIIDDKASKFWRFNVRLLDGLRQYDTWRLYSLGRFSIRDPFSYPMRTHFAYSRDWHPFVWQKKLIRKEKHKCK